MMIKFKPDQGKSTGWMDLARTLVFFLSALVISGCGGGNENSLETPQGVVNTFIDRIMEQNDLKGAFELLSEEDQKVIMQSPKVHSFIMGENDPELEAYSDTYEQMAPELLEMVNDLVKFNARKGEERDGYVEVGLEISYPSDYMSIAFIFYGMFMELQRKYGDVQIDTIPKAERDKIIWKIKNDMKNAVANIDTDKYSTYIFPVRVMDENGEWRINLGLAQQQEQLDFGN
ncbi:MAG TPA: hypothetical protein ENO22_04945 [candidate division Zixibacteria bacterium]|nr:hypothetical protein [candidate division Zixibacteria bacterium]